MTRPSCTDYTTNPLQGAGTSALDRSQDRAIILFEDMVRDSLGSSPTLPLIGVDDTFVPI